MKTQTKTFCITAKGEINKAVINALSNCRFDTPQTRIYTGYYSGSGRFASRASAEHTVVSILNAQRYKFTTGNDAPKGGILGDYVKMSKIAFDFIAALKNSTKQIKP